MSVNLLEVYKSTIHDTLVRQLSRLLGEASESISTASADAFSAITGLVISQGKTDQGARDLIRYFDSNKIDLVSVTDIPESLKEGDALDKLTLEGNSMLRYLAGDFFVYDGKQLI